MTNGQIFLTGATGNVGSHLLGSLLEAGVEKVACLVRATSEEAGRARVARALDAAGLDGARLGARVTAVPGDLSLPRLGMSEEAFASLAASLGQVIHCAAWLGNREAFSTESLANITGTTAIAELCVRANARLDHISSIGVLQWTQEEEDGSLPECVLTASPEPPDGRPGQHAYYFSKWMAEQIAIYAAAQVPVTVHRVGDVFSHVADAPLSAVVRAVAMMKALPDDDALSWSQHSISDAFAGRALAAIAMRPNEELRIMHDIAHVEGASVADVRRAFEARGVELATLPVDAWMTALRRDVPWLGMLTDWQVDYLVVPKRPVPRFVNRAFTAALAACDVVLPTIADRLAPMVAAAADAV